MKLKSVLLVMVLAVAATACTGVVGSGDVVIIEVPVEDFSRLEVSHGFDVDVAVGAEPSLTLRVDDNLEASLSFGVSGETLRIGIEPGTIVTNATLEADVTVTSLQSIEGSGAVAIQVEPLSGTSLDLELSGASQLDGTVDLESMTVRVSGASNLSLSGRVTTADIEASGASNLVIPELVVGSLRARLSGASVAEITVNDSLEATLSGASTLRYRGDPDVSAIETTGASTIGKIIEPG